MPVRTTVDIPEPLYEALRSRAEKCHASIRSLVVRAIQETYTDAAKGEYLTGPIVNGSGKLGSAFPKNENPHDFVFS